MTLPSPIPPALVDLIAYRFRLLGEPMRLSAVDLLRGAGELSVGEVAERLKTSEQNASKHLVDLHAAKVLERRRDGNRVLYAVREDSAVMQMCEAVCGSLEHQLGELQGLFAEPNGPRPTQSPV